jgi:hypothetical protein
MVEICRPFRPLAFSAAIKRTSPLLDTSGGGVMIERGFIGSLERQLSTV